MISIKQLNQRLHQDKQSKGKSNYYNYFNMGFGESATLSFLPDLNDDNPYGFFVEKVYHVLEINGEYQKVPCLGSYGGDEKCPICEQSRKYYKDKNDELGKRFWKKKSRVLQCLVNKDPLPADDSGENSKGKVKLLSMGFQLYQTLGTAMEDLEYMPCDYEHGIDFILRKTRQGTFANYSTSKFAKAPRALDAATIAYVKPLLIDLSSLLPPKPDITEMTKLLAMAVAEGSPNGVPSVSPVVPVTSVQDDDDDDEYYAEAQATLDRVRNRKNG